MPSDSNPAKLSSSNFFKVFFSRWRIFCLIFRLLLGTFFSLFRSALRFVRSEICASKSFDGGAVVAAAPVPGGIS